MLQLVSQMLTCQFLSFTEGHVALIIGGESETGPAVEVFSPDGKCQHQLANIPISTLTLHLPALGYVEGKIISCGGVRVRIAY